MKKNKGRCEISRDAEKFRVFLEGKIT
jgi:hypothetical protein